MMGRKQKLSGGDEFETVSRKARRVHISFGRPGYAKQTKAKMNRRWRKESKAIASTEPRGFYA